MTKDGRVWEVVARKAQAACGFGVLILVGLVTPACGSHSMAVTVTTVHEIPPAGLRVVFRVLRDDGEPVGRLAPTDITVMNDEAGRPFASEGGGVPVLGNPTEYGLYTILVLDFSDSIAAHGAVGEVVSGARAFVKAVVADQPPAIRQQVAIYAFGSTSESELWCDFTNDFEILNRRLDDLAAAPSRGGTNLYGAYLFAMDYVSTAGAGALASRSLVLLTDGTHEAGDGERLRNAALSTLVRGRVDTYTIGIRGDYDEGAIRELASAPAHFYLVDEASAMVSAFTSISSRVAAIANSNYVLGVCSPVESRWPSLTVSLSGEEGMLSSFQVAYPAGDIVAWTGNVRDCDASKIASEAPPADAWIVNPVLHQALPLNGFVPAEEPGHLAPTLPEVPVSAPGPAGQVGGPDPTAVRTAFEGMQVAVGNCLGGRSGAVEVEVLLDGRSGMATELAVHGDDSFLRGSEACIGAAVAAARFPSFPGDPLRVQYVFRF